MGREDADSIDLLHFADTLRDDAILYGDFSLDNANQRDNAQVIIEPGVDNQRLQRFLAPVFRGRDDFNNLLEQLTHAQTTFRTDLQGIGGIDADNLLDFLADPVGFRLRQVNLVKHRQHLKVLLNRGIAVGH